MAVGAGVGPNNVGEVECELTAKTTQYTHGKNIRYEIKGCRLGARNVVLDAKFGPPPTRDISGNYYYPGPVESNNAMIYASGTCDGKDFEGECYALIGGERNYTLDITRPTCEIDPGPYYSNCSGVPNPYACPGDGTPCCSSNAISAPTSDCGTATPSTNPADRPLFNYSGHNDGDITGNRNAIQWNIDGNPHTLKTVGSNRVVRMFEITCDGHRLYYGTVNGKEGINCGAFEIIAEGSNVPPPSLASCQANVSCTINYCNTDKSIPPPIISCKDGSSSSNPVFKYTSENSSTLSGTTLSNWNSGKNQTITTTTTPSTRSIFLQQVICGETPYNCGTSNGLSCGTVKIVKDRKDCPSDVTATCKLVDKSNAEVTSLIVTQGENVKAPKITCSNGETASWPTFSSSQLPTGAASNWRDDGTAYYTNEHAPGSYTISASVNCGATIVSNIPCGTITVQKPTCTSPSGNYAINQSVPPPDYNCGENVPKANPKFNYTSANDGSVSSNAPTGWNNTNPPGNHAFTAAVANRNVYMYQIDCDGHTLNLGASTGKDGVHCSGSFNILSSGSSTPSSSSARSSSSVASSSSGGSGGGTSSGSGGGTSGCVAGATNYTTKDSYPNVGTAAICIKFNGDIAGWNASNSDGRTCTTSGGGTYTGSTISGASVSKTSDGYAYINCTAGTSASFGFAFW